MVSSLSPVLLRDRKMCDTMNRACQPDGPGFEIWPFYSPVLSLSVRIRKDIWSCRENGAVVTITLTEWPPAERGPFRPLPFFTSVGPSLCGQTGRVRWQLEGSWDARGPTSHR